MNDQTTLKTPSEYAAAGDAYDCTVLLGQLGETRFGKEPAWPMYSFDRPSSILWNGVAATLNRRGWTDKEIAAWLASKETRWALDSELGDALAALGALVGAKAQKVGD